MGRVSRSELDDEIAALEREVQDRRAGVFGPASTTWEVAREAVIFLGAGRAALLQLAHPYVGVAVGEHSVTVADPVARFQGTFYRMFRMVFGDLDEAVGAARAVYATHARIRGRIGEDTPRWAADHGYDARDRDAKIWVLATLWDTSLDLFQRIVRPLAPAELARYYAENTRFARLFGVSRDLPADYPAFRAWVDAELDAGALHVTRAARAVAQRILHPENALGRLLQVEYEQFTAELLPDALNRAFGLPLASPARRRAFDRTIARARRLLPHLPRRLRYLPPYLDAERRLAGAQGRDRVGELLSRLYVGPPRAS